MRPCQSSERGQALVLVAVSLASIIGVLALASDLGWNHYVRKSAQTASDAAAMAAAIEALSAFGNGTANCGGTGTVACQPDAVSCASATRNLATGCLYAQKNGFTAGGKSGRQTLTMAANAGTVPPTAPGVNDVYYWVTATARQNMPLGFAAILTSGATTVGTRSTAVVTNGVQGGTLYLLNRQNDTSPVGTGMNIDLGGNTTLTAPGGIFMASNKNPSAKLQGTPKVTAPRTFIRGSGALASGGSAQWQVPPKNGFPDMWYFKDPFRGKGQPPALPSTTLPAVPVPGGDLSLLPQPLRSGQYYAVGTNGQANAAKLTVGTGVTFQDGAFGNYVLYGGLTVGAQAKVYSGRYVLAGVKSNNREILTITNNGALVDNTTAAQQNTDAGEIFILTDTNYPSLVGKVPAAVQSVASQLGLGEANLQSGNSQIVTVHGLNRDSASLPTNLKDFAPTAIWQDQRNSRVMYDATGNIDLTSCGAGHTIDTPCTNASMANSTAPRLKLQAHPNTTIYGAIYQPRGAWFDLQGNGTIKSPMIIITGALVMDGGCDIGKMSERDELKTRVVALVE